MDYLVGVIIGAIVGAAAAWIYGKCKKKDGGATPKSGGGPGSEE